MLNTPNRGGRPKAGDDRIDLTLAVISCVSKPGKRWGIEELSRASDINPKTLVKVENSAMRKLRLGLRGLNPRLFDELATA